MDRVKVIIGDIFDTEVTHYIAMCSSKRFATRPVTHFSKYQIWFQMTPAIIMILNGPEKHAQMKKGKACTYLVLAIGAGIF